MTNQAKVDEYLKDHRLQSFEQLKEIESELDKIETESLSIQAKLEFSKNGDIKTDPLELSIWNRANKRRLGRVKKDFKFITGNFEVIDNATEDTESPVAEVSRLLIKNFEICNAFGTLNSTAIANIIGRKLSTNQMHKAILNNFNGVRFRKQNGGFTYTLRRRDTVI